MSKLSPETEALIAAALLAGRLTRVPPGEVALKGDAVPGAGPSPWAERPPAPAAPAAPKRRGPPPDAVIRARRKLVREMNTALIPVREIALALRTDRETVARDLAAIGVKASVRDTVVQGTDKALARRAKAVVRAEAAIKDRRRFKMVPVPSGLSRKSVEPEATGTLYPGYRQAPGKGRAVLIDGKHNSKIGGDVLVGWLRGAKIFTLTLEERATCPPGCDFWTTCYGNAMERATRWAHGAALEAALPVEVAALCAAHEKVLIRLHVLGDFYSPEYLALWASLLDLWPNLFIFGFTAHLKRSPMGILIAGVRAARPERFFMRHSSTTGDWGSFVVDFPTEMPRLGDAVVCPEQRDAMNGTRSGLHCGSCGLCFKGATCIAFIQH